MIDNNDFDKDYIKTKVNKIKHHIDYLIDKIFNEENIKDLSKNELNQITQTWRRMVIKELNQIEDKYK